MFISEDTYKGTFGNPQSQNGYAYVWNNPLLYTDPSGYSPNYNSIKDKTYELFSTTGELMLAGYTHSEAEFFASGIGNVGAKYNQLAQKYAQEHNPKKNSAGTLITWDNEADAFRHFSWNFEATRKFGKTPTEIATANHEFIAHENYSIVKQDKGTVVIDVQLATLMDLNNNNEGRYLGMTNSGDAKSWFEWALKNNALITSLDQVATKYGFDPSLWNR